MNDQPKQGVYLDHTLAIIGSQVDERIDELSRRRRNRTRIVITALALITALSGSAAAYAVSTSTHVSAKVMPSESTAITEVQCSNSANPTSPEYFTAQFRAPRGEKVNRTAVCAEARAELLSNPARFASLTPDATIAAAATIIEEGGTRYVTVLRASFGSLTPGSTVSAP